MKKTKIVIGVFFSLCAIAVVLFFSIRYLLTKSFPEYDSTLTAAGLNDEVRIYRTEFGVPHIVANNTRDLFFAQGYVHAQDRLWQMDISRRAGEGRLSEVLGTSTISFDRMLKTIGFKTIAQQLEKQLHPQSIELLQAYSDGVNEFIRSHKGKYPIEFDMLNYEPEEWTPVHSLMIARLMAWELNISWHVDVVLGELVAALGLEKARQVFPTYPENAPVIAATDFSQERLAALRAFTDAQTEFKQFFGTGGTHIGSNAWAVAPSRSASGKAMLANDPHLGLGLPAKWYEIHLKGGEINVAGYSLPGAPLVILGHTPDIAWGFTNLMADDADFYLEKTDSLNAGKYLFKGEWKNFDVHNDTIWVKDSLEVPITIRRTHHGPMINDCYPISHYRSSDVISMKWTGYEMSDELYAVYRITVSKNWNEFLTGVKEFTVPGQNFVYADIQGNIGYQAGVRLPKRTTNNPTLPFPGWTGEHEWTGFIPFDELPTIYNPAEGFIATANNKTTDRATYHISNLWEPPSRIQRITEVLRSKEKFDVYDFKKLQNDNYSHFARELTPYILTAFRTAGRSERIETALNYFRNWNYILDKDDVPTTIFEVFFQHLIKNTYRDEMGDELYNRYIFLANMPYRVTLSLLADTSTTWFDNTATPAIETRDDIIAKSLNDALDELSVLLGGEMKEWRWGRLHTLTLQHPFGEMEILQPIFNIGPAAMSGSGTTVNNGEYRMGKPYAMWLGPSMRHIVDFSNVNGSLSVIPSGQSGQPLHPHYSDQFALWKNGEYHVVTMDVGEIARKSKNILYLTPSR
ncbi:MAG: penicillin acylase family protein [Bacteroidota bacterium]